jgi:predicted MPP superfamily phosphohydrolase
MRILHLSDLHIQTKADAETFFTSLFVDLTKDLELRALDAVIVTGDITMRASAPEFDAALRFLSDIRKEFGVSDAAMIVVPGNHDVDWAASIAAMKSVRSTAAARNPDSIPDPKRPGKAYLTDPDAYRKRFTNFCSFYRALTGRDYPLEYENQFSVTHLREHGVVVLGLNSAWDLNHVNAAAASVHRVAFSRALREVMAIKEAPIRIGAWHHPIDYAGDDRIRDGGFVEQLTQCGFCLAVHGHIHDVTTRELQHEHQADGRRMHLLAAGTFGAPSKELPTGTPWEYNVLEIDNPRLKVIARQRKSLNASWRPYGAWQRNSSEVSSSRTLMLSCGEAMIRSRDDLIAHLDENRINAIGKRVAVEAHIFDDRGHILLQRRGPKARDEVGRLEGIGGDIRSSLDLHAALRSEVKKELGDDVEVAIDKLLEVRRVTFIERDHDPQDWLVVSYLCRLASGTPRVVNPELTTELKFFSLRELSLLKSETLSRSTAAALSTYRNKYGDQPYFLTQDATRAC